MEVKYTNGVADKNPYYIIVGERWENIPSFDGYQISDYGRLRCCRDNRGNLTDTYRIVRPSVDKDGYFRVTMTTYEKPRKSYHKLVNRLVAEAFIGPSPEPNMVVDHIDDNKQNNKATNLQWTTAPKNSTLAAMAGLYRTRPVIIIETGEKFDSIRECAKAIDADPADINHYFSGKIKHVKGFHFEYLTDKSIRPAKFKKLTSFLYDYQLDAVNRLRNGCILCGSVGSGKSRTGLFYYFKENGGWIDSEKYIPMKTPQDLYIITTAKKRDSKEWEGEIANFALYPDENGITRFGNKVIIDSWNNIKKYQDVRDSFFLLDEQRLVSYGTWTKAFLKIAKFNHWILLTGTPGDSYSEYLPVFLANGFFRNKTEFNREHVEFSRYAKFPKIERYHNTGRLDRLRDRILVNMNYKHEIQINHIDISCTYDIRKYKEVMKNRWNPYKEEPIQDAGGLCHVLRRIVNSDESRQVKLLEILENYPRAIIFYNYNYERDILLNLAYEPGTEVAEWTGHAHQPIPEGDRWIYICQYNSACEGWNCIRTNCVIFYSQNYSYKVMTQAAGRIDRLNTKYESLYYYHLKSKSGIDLAISRALHEKRKFNERKWCKWD